jgi:hypothetical protein
MYYSKMGKNSCFALTGGWKMENGNQGEKLFVYWLLPIA